MVLEVADPRLVRVSDEPVTKGADRTLAIAFRVICVVDLIMHEPVDHTSGRSQRPECG
jgi:hypothetical protein